MIRRRLLLSLMSMALILPDAVLGDKQETSVPPKPLSRAQFAQQMALVTDGMTPEQVVSLLGKPDYIGHDHTIPVWYYGCVGEYRIPTLGTVQFTNEGKVNYHHGYLGTPPSPSIVSESELRTLMLILHDTPHMDRFDPAAFVRVVNRLIPYGKAKFLAALTEYDRVLTGIFPLPEETKEWKDTPDPGKSEGLAAFEKRNRRSNPTHGADRFIPLVRLLFLLSPKELHKLPPLRVGGIFPAQPADPTDSPLYPLVLVDDVPILQIHEGIFFSGVSGGVTEDLEFFRKHGVMRKNPLSPSGSLSQVLAHVESSQDWLLSREYRPLGAGGEAYKDGIFRPDEASKKSGRDWIKAQLLNALAPLYPSEIRFTRATNTLGGAATAFMDIEQWDAIIEDLSKRPIRWNPTRNQYER